MTYDEYPSAAPVIAVTGGTGFIGGHLIDCLTARGWRVRALTRGAAIRCGATAVAATPALVETVTGDLADAAALAALVSGTDAVVHCAGLTAARSRAAFEAVNVAGIVNLAAAVARQERPPSIILLSSVAAREPHLSAYAASKRRAEEAAACGDLNCLVVRAPVVYGPGDRATLPLFRMLARGWALRPSWPTRFSLLHVTDLAAALAALAAAPTAVAHPDRPLELADGQAEGYGWDDLKGAAETVLGRRLRALPVTPGLLGLAAAGSAAVALAGRRAPLFGPGKAREMRHSDWVSRTGDGARVPDWRPQISLRRGFEETIDWYRREGWL